MRTCPNCGRQNADDQDFCSCGEYLRWTPTGYTPAVQKPAPPADSAPTSDGSAPAPAAAAPAAAAPPPPAAAVAPPPAPLADTVALTLRRTDEVADLDSAGGIVGVSVEPGARAVLYALVRNQSGVVDNYDLTVVGLPDGWWSISPATVYLVPMGAGAGTDEQEVAVHIHPPRVPQAVARTWAFEVVVHSRAYGAQASAAPAEVEVGAYVDVRTELLPDRQRGRRQAQFTLAAENRANAPVELRLDARDTDAECSFHFAQPEIIVEPAERVEVPLVVRPPRQIWVGRSRDRQFEAGATAPADADVVLPPGMATYRQRSWLPWWLVPAVPLLIVAAILVLLLMPKKATVPDVTKLSSRFAVQQALTKAELNPVPQVVRVRSGGKPGTITAQAPTAGSKVKKGSLVTIQVVVGSGEVLVPKIVGLKVQAAAAALDQTGLKLGEVLPAPPDPNGTIGSQIPAAGKAAHPGDGVMVFIAKAPASKAGTASGKAAKKAVPVPKVAGQPLAQAAAALAQAGLLPTEVQRYSAAKPGTLIGTIPPAGKPLAKGAKITLLVSAGFPQLIFDTGEGLMQVKGTGGQASPLAGTSPGDSEASWSPDGTQIAFVSGDDLLLAEPGKPGSALLHRPGKSFRDPAFAPAGQVLAVVKRSATDGDLCLSRIRANRASLSCITDPSTDVGRSVSWSSDGRSILIAAHPKDKPDTFGLVLYRSAVPFSTRAADWRGSLVTDATKPGRGALAGAFSPDGKRLAIASNQAGGGFQLFVTKPDDFKLAKAATLPVAACSIAWRPDSAELVVVSNPGCQSGVLGQIARVDPAHPNRVVVLAAQGAHPAWQPLKLGS